MENNHPAVILLDIDMPETDGYETIKILKSKPETKETPVILLDDRAGSVDEVKINSMGAAGCIYKPLDPQTLIACIEKFAG